LWHSIQINLKRRRLQILEGILVELGFTKVSKQNLERSLHLGFYGMKYPTKLEYIPSDTTKRTKVTIKDTFTGVTKRAPHIILGLLSDEEKEVHEAVECDVAFLGERGIQFLAVTRTEPDSDDWKMVGLF
jgi:hypothetical protein